MRLASCVELKTPWRDGTTHLVILPPEVAPLRTAAMLEMSERTARSSVIRGPKAVSQQRRLLADSVEKLCSRA
jgi:hypothetical protein